MLKIECIHIVCTRGVYMWCVHAVRTCGVHMWCVRVVCTCGVSWHSVQYIFKNLEQINEWIIHITTMRTNKFLLREYGR